MRKLAMSKKSIHCTIMTVALLFLAGALFLAAADDDERERHRERRRERHREKHHAEEHLQAVNNPVFKEQCSQCHFAYQPQLLPSASWMKIIENLDDHFGDAVELDEDAKQIISDYLEANGAEKSSAEIAVKIMRRLGHPIPLRITDTAYIKEKHHEISAEILKRESIGSLSNCEACHITAENGDYDDDAVRIPK
jgi:hypothetical protein